MNIRTLRMATLILFLSPISLFVTSGRTFAALGVPIYWVEGGFNNGRLGKVDIDGSGFQVLFTGLGNPLGVDVDPISGYIYWTEGSTQKIRRANLDGSNPVDILTNLPGPSGISLDLVNSKVYWTNATNAANNPSVQRANLDGTNVQTLFTGADATSVEVDMVGSKIYWTQGINSNVNTLRRANLDGSSPQTLFTAPVQMSGSGVMYGLSVGYDTAFYPQGRVYFSLQTNTPSDTLETMDLNGGPTTTIASNGVYSIYGVDYYPGYERVLWVNNFSSNNSGEIYWSKPDGSMAQLIMSIGLNHKLADVAVWPYLPPVPEPNSAALVAAALTCLAAISRYRRM
jgi:hypothetical protein